MEWVVDKVDQKTVNQRTVNRKTVKKLLRDC